MRLELTGRHIDITPDLDRLVHRKIAKLERLLNSRAVSVHTVLSVEKHRHRTEVTLHAAGDVFFHGVGDTGDWQTSVADAVEKILQQAQKLKGKAQVRKSGRAAAAARVKRSVRAEG